MSEQVEEYTPYIMIPPWVMFEPNLKPLHWALVGIITGLSQKDGYCWASNAYISRKYNLSIDQIQDGLAHLEKQGLIKRSITKSNTNKWKTVRHLTLVNFPCPPSVEPDLRPSANADLQASAKPHIDNKTYNKDHIKVFLEEEKKQPENILIEGMKDLKQYSRKLEANSRLEIKRDPKIQEVLDKALKPLDASIEQDNRYTLLSRRPMVKYPLIWLSERDLEQAIETCQARGVQLRAVLAITHSWAEQQILQGKPEKYINVVSAIQGWAIERALSIQLLDLKIENQETFINEKGKKR